MIFTPPAYGDRSLADVVPSVARALGVPLDGHPVGLELPPAPSYVVFLVDGMGAELLTRHTSPRSSTAPPPAPPACRRRPRRR
jgi:hypothetical protein